MAGALGSGGLGGRGQSRHNELRSPRSQLRSNGEPARQVGFEGGLVRVAGLWGGELARDFGHDHAVGRGLRRRRVQTSALDEEDTGAVVDKAREARTPG